MVLCGCNYIELLITHTKARSNQLWINSRTTIAGENCVYGPIILRYACSHGAKLACAHCSFGFKISERLRRAHFGRQAPAGKVPSPIHTQTHSMSARAFKYMHICMRMYVFTPSYWWCITSRVNDRRRLHALWKWKLAKQKLERARRRRCSLSPPLA